ncbi:MAG: Type II and III secretion system protein [candidate division TM6 bacterium GW2011_GWF2_38_10]|nr:MAG: Type II and III secretion system protein [candidate division TM6 bacterium GW2011_GWF2_38_10]
MKFNVDKDGNRLIVSSSDKVDWRLVKQTIKDLDKPQPQVAIETLMVAVTVDDRKQIGGNIHPKKAHTLGQNIGFQSAVTNTEGPSLSLDNTDSPNSLLGDMITQITTQKGLSVLTFGKKDNLWAVFSMLKEEKNATIISQPFITVGNKVAASVAVGSSKRVLGQESGTMKGYKEVNDGTTINITPQINIDGIIRMELSTEIKEFTDTAGNNSTNRNIQTNVSIADGQVLVLGGFVKTKVTENKYKTPLLGDLPLVGWFFKNQARTVAKEYLFIFLCPTIIKPRQSPGIGTYTKMKLHNVTDSIEQSIQTKRTPDPIHNWIFNPERENYSHKVIDFANARYQPTTVNIQDDPYYRAATKTQDAKEEKEEAEELARDIAYEGAPRLQETPPPPLEKPIAQNPLEQEAQPTTHVATLQKTHTDHQITVQPTIPSPTNTTIESPLSIQATEPQRTQFKNLISTDETNQEPTLTIDMEKRNKLKDFLSNNPALAYNKQHFNQKGKA